MSTDKQRKGSLAWRQNSKKGYRTRVPVLKKGHSYTYYIKVETKSDIIDGVLQCCTVLQRVPLEKVEGIKYKLKYPELGVKRTIRKEIIREINGKPVEELIEEVENSAYVDATAITRGKGTQGPVRVCGLSLGLRKTKRGFTRRPGSMGGRKPGRIFPTKPFAKKMGNSRRTILNLKVLGRKELSNYESFKYFCKAGNYLIVKGSIPGTQGSTVALRPAIRLS